MSLFTIGWSILKFWNGHYQINNINVGKNPGFHCVPQDEINALLVQYAQTLCAIVRLKVAIRMFLDAGLKKLNLVETGIPFEVVPGIKLNHWWPDLCWDSGNTPLNFASRFHVVTGHTRGSQQQDWRQLAKLNEHCGYRHERNLAFICENY